MALSLALELVGGEFFQLFTGSVTTALERKAAFRDRLQDINYTLTSLRRQTAVIEQIQEYNVDLSLSNNDIIQIVRQMTEGRELIDRLSGIKFHLWNFCCTNDCAEQLEELNRILEGLFDTLQLQQVRDCKETLKLARQNRDDLQKMKAMLEEILQKIDNPELKGLLKRLGDQNSGDARDASTSSSSSNSNSASGGNTEDEGNGLAQEALVEAALGLLIDAVIEVKGSTQMFRPLFKRLESTLDCLRPFIKEMAQDKKLLDRPKEELENLKIQMEKGVVLVRKCLSVCRWSSNKKDRYTNQVVELDECLQGHLSILKMKVARNVSETSGLIRNIQEVVNRIRGSDFQGSCDIVEPPIPPVKLKVKEPLVSEVNITEGSGAVHNLLESKGSYCDVVGPSTPGFEEFLKRRKDYTKETLDRGNLLFPKRPGQPLCPFYMTTGDCKFGLNCTYHHPDCVSSPTGLTLRPETMPNLSELSVVSPLTVGLDMHLKELKRKFLYNQESSILVLSGPAGCGKTRLAKAFCQDDEVKDKFRDNIFFVTVSKKPSIDLIAHQILCQLKDYEVPEAENQVTAVEWLGQFMKEAGQYPLLLVLDDVWQASEFHDKCNELKIPNVKILATSRSQLHGFGSPYYINALSDEEAMALIRRSAFLEDGCSYVPEDILRKTVTYCKGLPLALQAIGRSLCDKSTAIWQSRIEELSKGSSISSCESDLLRSLKLSYDALAENPILKECFLDLSLFPECQRVPVDALIDMWGELYGVDENIPIKNLHELTTRGLAKLVGTRKEKVEVDGYYSTLHFTMHDIIRDLVTHLTSQKPIEQRSRLTIETLDGKLPHQIIRIREQKSQPMKARLVLISTDELFSQNWHNMELPDAEVLVLNFQTENYALPEFVQNMIKLKVLIVTSSGTLPAFWPVGFLPAQLSNFQLLSPLPNLRTIRLERISISSLRMHSIQLKCLQKMSLFKCRIGQTFSNPSIQISDTFPNLVETKIDHCNDLVELPAICDLVNLRKLSLIHCHYLITLPQKIGKLAKLEVFRLESCTVLEMLPGSIMNLNKLAFLDLSNCVSLKELPERIGELRNLKTLNMRGCSSLQKLPLSVLDLKQLQIVVCDEERQKLWKPLLPRLKNLRLKLRFRELQF